MHGSWAVLVDFQEVAASVEDGIEAGGEASDVCGDVGKDTRCGLVVVGDLKQNTGQMWRSRTLRLVILFCGRELLWVMGAMKSCANCNCRKNVCPLSFGQPW